MAGTDVIPERLKGLNSGATWVVLSTMLVVGATVLVTICWWDFFAAKDTPTDVFRNMGLLAAGFVALVFAFWRGAIAKDHQLVSVEQAATARLDYLHGRFQRALELFSKEGLGQSAIRISGMHAMYYLVRDAPEEFARATVHIVTTFMVQAEVDSDGRDLTEFRVARITAAGVCDLLDKDCLLTESSRRRLRKTVDDASDLMEKRLRAARKETEPL